MYRGLKETADGRVLYLDMNAFFASVEQQFRPELREKPLAVVSHAAPGGTVLAASYEAKAYGIATGTKVGIARSLCPQLLLAETTPGLYRSVHAQFMRILFDVFGPEAQARSIDEAVLFMPPNWVGSAQCWELARAIKSRFRREIGPYLRCSVGIAPNSLLGKLASNLQKPDGLVEITLENTPGILADLRLTDLPGIAERSAASLGLAGLATPLDLYRTPPDQLRRRFGIWGQYWWWRLHGFEPDCSLGGGPSQSMSHQHVLRQWLTSFEEAEAVTVRMADRLIHRLRRNSLQCQRIGLYCNLAAAPSLGAERRLDVPSASYPVLQDGVRQLLESFPRPLQGAVRKITVCLDSLTPSQNGLQLDLFQTRLGQEKASQAVQAVRNRFGFDAVLPGSLVGLDRSVAREQLGFGRIRDRP